MVAFAANSLLARVAVREALIDAGSFTAIRLLSGAAALWLLVAWRRGAWVIPRGSWQGALALFVYAAAFSFAYLDLTAAMGALILFGAVQLTMIGFGLVRGTSLSVLQFLGLTVAACGLIGLLLPGLVAPPLASALVMSVSGIAWGAYSLLGRGVGDPLGATAGNFVYAGPMAIALLLFTMGSWQLSWLGVTYAILSGVVASGVGYALWYRALPALSAPVASSVQLSVPPIAALAGVLLLGELLTSRLVLGSVAVLGGVALVILAPAWRPDRR